MCTPQAPTPPDPTATAAAQTQSNVQTATANAALNRVNQYTPYGSSVYSITGTNPDGTPNYSQTTSLSPQQQSLLDMTQQGEQTLGQTALGQLGNVQNTYSQPFNASGLPQVTGSVPGAGGVQSTLGNAGNIQGSLDTSGLPGIQSSVNNSGPGITGQVNGGQSWQDAVQQAQNAAYGQQTQYLDPQFSQGQQSLNAQLANQGLSTGDTAYNNAQTNFANQKQQAYQSAQDSAVAAGNAEQNTLYGQGLSSANLQNSANLQGYNEGLSNATLANSANSQGFNQALQGATFGNTAQQQQYGQNLASGTFGNAAQQQLYGQNLSGANLQNSASAQALNQALGLYNQPLNSYNALATGAQVQNPTFGSVPTSTQQGTDVAGITNSAYQNQLQAYQQQMSGINNLFGLGGSLGAAAILA
jgi:hypothetical protein